MLTLPLPLPLLTLPLPLPLQATNHPCQRCARAREGTGGHGRAREGTGGSGRSSAQEAALMGGQPRGRRLSTRCGGLLGDAHVHVVLGHLAHEDGRVASVDLALGHARADGQHGASLELAVRLVGVWLSGPGQGQG